jgi:flagellar biosynthesis GTPase FlhF
MNEPGVALGDDVSQGEDGVVPVVEEETEEEAHVRKQRQKMEAEAAKKALKAKHEKFNAFVSARQKQEPEEQRRFTEEMKRQMEALPPGSLSNPKAMHDFYSGFEAYWHRHETQKWLNEWKGTWTSLLVGPEEVEALELLGEEVEQEDAISTQAVDDGDLGSLAGVRSDAEPQ